MGRVAEARAALAVERKADEAVDRILGDLAELDDDAMERVLSRLVGLLQGQSREVVSPPATPKKQPVPSAQSFADLPAPVQPGAKELKRLSGLPEEAIAERVMGWVVTSGEEAVANAFAATRSERPPHEISFIESYLGLE